MKHRFVISTVFLTLASFAAGQESSIKAPPLESAAPNPVPGLTLTLTAGGKTDARSARLIALYVPAGQPLSPFVPGGAFTARWEGEINSPLRAEYTFAADIKGSFNLAINGTPVLEGAGDVTSQSVNKAFQLKKGANKLVAEFVSDGSSDALVRLNWWAKDFPAEPIPPTAFTHTPSQLERSAGRIREGRLLFAQHRCAACHADATAIPAKGEGMPELAHDAPLFDDLGSKFNEQWLAHWINDPHAFRPHSLMPRVFHGEEGKVDPRAADLAAFFASTGKKDDTTPAAENAPLGGALFANLGCIACHSTPGISGDDEYHRVPLSHLRAKWQPPALREYLKNPEKRYAWTHMPNFRLTDDEAERLTAFLLSGEQKKLAETPAGDAARGAQLLVSAGCLNCHAGLPPTTQPTLAATLQAGWQKGCMAADAKARGAAPDFGFKSSEREALLAFGADGFGSLKQDVPIEFAERQVRMNRCTACHARDASPGTWANLENEMAPLQAAAPSAEPAAEGAAVGGTTVPVMTWFGEKLKPFWMEPFIAGKIGDKPRPWLLARMPAFSTYAPGLTAGFSLEHGFSLTPDVEEAVDPKAAENGEKLLGDSGFNCVTCHAVGERAATAVFEAPGPNFARSYERLRKGYYHRWVMHPLRIDPDTKMPRFADDEGKTPLTDFYDGNARQQFEAIWQYLRTLTK